jgi:hypothetical protein
MTNFVDCFKEIERKLKTVEPGSNFSIIFLTDGNDTCNSKGQIEKSITDLKVNLKNISEKMNVSSSIFCLGFSSSHDAVLLNRLAQSGSELGNFIYIDTSVGGAVYSEQLMGAFSECLNMAMVQAKDKLILSKPNADFQQKLDLNMEHIFKEIVEEDEALDPQSMIMDEKDEI